MKLLYLDISQNLKFDMSRNEYISTISFFSSVRSLIHARLFATPRTAVCQASLSITNSRTLLKLMSIELAIPSNHLNLCCLPLLLPSILPSIRILSNESVVCIRWPKYLSFSLIISPSNEYSGLISFRIDWYDLLAVQETQESSPALQFESISSSVLSLLYGPTLISMTTGKAIALTRQTFVSKVMSLLLNKLSRFVSFSSKEQASSNVMAAVTIQGDFETQENKVCHCFDFFPHLFAMK